MTMEQIALCDTHQILLTFIWSWGGGCAIQPLLVEIMTEASWYASPQMCRRAIRKLKHTGLLKASHWLDGKTELLMLCKPAIEWISEQPAVASYPKHNTRDQEKLSICRMLVAKNAIKLNLKTNPSYVFSLLMGSSDCTMGLRINELPEYYEKVLSERLPKSEYESQMEQLALSRQQRTAMRSGTKGTAVNPSIVTVETLHRHGIYVLGFSQRQLQWETKTVIQFCYFGIHHLTVSRMRELLEVCQKWSWGFGSSCELELVFCCTSSAKRKALDRELSKITSSGEPYWRTAFKSVLGYYDAPCPFRFSPICEQERYFPVTL